MLTSHHTSQLFLGRSHSVSFEKSLQVSGIKVKGDLSVLFTRNQGERWMSQTDLLLIPVLATPYLLPPQIWDRSALHSSEPLCNSKRFWAAAFSFICLSFHLQEIFLNLSLDLLPMPTASPLFSCYGFLPFCYSELSVQRLFGGRQRHMYMYVYISIPPFWTGAC